MSTPHTNFTGQPGQALDLPDQLRTLEYFAERFILPVSPELTAEHIVSTPDGAMLRLTTDWEPESPLGSIAAMSIKETFDIEPTLALIFGGDSILSSTFTPEGNESEYMKAVQLTARILELEKLSSNERAATDYLQETAAAKYAGLPVRDAISYADGTHVLPAEVIRKLVADNSKTIYSITQRKEELDDDTTISVIRRSISGFADPDDEFLSLSQLEVELIDWNKEAAWRYSKALNGQQELETPETAAALDKALADFMGNHDDGAVNNHLQGLGLYAPSRDGVSTLTGRLRTALKISYKKPPTVFDI